MMKRVILFLVVLAVLVYSSSPLFAQAAAPSGPKYLIILISDGQGANQQLAANLYTGTVPDYQKWPNHTWMSTFPDKGSYDPALFWSDFNYALNGPTDSAAAATAMYTGVKTANGRISVSADGLSRLVSLGDLARSQGLALGAVTTSPISDATPAALISHNDNRNNFYALADEALWGNPATTGLTTDLRYGGAHGNTTPPVDVWIGSGHPGWNTTNINLAIRNKLASESGMPGAFTFVERLSGHPDGGARLIQASNQVTVTRLAGLFGGTNGSIEYRLADGSGATPENPTLVEMASAALNVLNRNPKGFVAMFESGTVDHAGHSNNLNAAVGEEIAFNDLVKTVTDWVDDPSTAANWDNTLVIATADHETGYLTAGNGVFPDPSHPIGPITQAAFALEKPVSGTNLRASWEDANQNSLIDPGEKVYWTWNSINHSNSLVPFYARGVGANLVKCYHVGRDPVRGLYMDNTSVYQVAASVLNGVSHCAFHEQSQEFVNHSSGVRYFQTSGGHGVNPWSSDTTTISFSVTSTPADNANLYYTTDGSLPSGSMGSVSGSTRSLACSAASLFGDPQETVYTCAGIPPQPRGVTVRYSLDTWSASASFDLFADSTDCHLMNCAEIYSYQVSGPNALYLSFLRRSP